MPCKIYLRRDQSLSQRKVYSVKDSATIFAPLWVKERLMILGQHLSGITFEVYDNDRSIYPAEAFTITDNFNEQSLAVLQKIARNEALNVSGVINKTLYPDVDDVKVLYSIRDLVRQCVIVGVDNCSRCGGYCCESERQAKQRAYICDLAALQFQQPYNTGRLVLVQKEEKFKGVLDDFIYEHIVAEKKKSYSEVQTLLKEPTCDTPRYRYVPHDGWGVPCYIDTFAYKKFVANDVVLAGMALSEMAAARGDKINFKFLKYGTGFFAWRFGTELNRHILEGVLDGLEDLFGREDPSVKAAIQCVELPFYRDDMKSSKRMKDLMEKYKINIWVSTFDALKRTQHLVATTNCGDNHAACGNEMGFSSVDAAIAENLESKGNLLCPNINTMINEKYLEI